MCRRDRPDVRQYGLTGVHYLRRAFLPLSCRRAKRRLADTVAGTLEGLMDSADRWMDPPDEVRFHVAEMICLRFPPGPERQAWLDGLAS